MPLLECRAIAFAHGIETVLDGVDLTLERGERTGLVGVNGSGKTTLCRILLRELEPEAGELHLAAGARVGYLSQDPRLDPDQSVRDEAMSVFADLGALHDHFAAATAAIGDAAEPAELQHRLEEQSRVLAELEHRGGFDYEQRMLSTLAALGFGMDDLDRPVWQLSGGEKSRLALARMLESGCDVLLLDEPTNHLDIPMTEWLESFLRGFAGAALIVSHDRWFLDNVCQTIVELEGGRATRYHFGEGDAKLPPLDDPDAPEDETPGHYGAYTHFQRVKGERRAAEGKA
ncbi:MAG: ABC-F family ATP-binding cassette domain-containing protein, partial [Armatimonadetes bacterium]|nr:ABC-F family ATP-binding cassette domain-containing protein [Armatimonadota bacterium]